MLKLRKRYSSILLLGMCVLFMTQEIVVNQVLCYKENGALDVELAFLGFQCQCKTNCAHDHYSATEPVNTRQLAPHCINCFDLPLDGAWLNRDMRNAAPDIHLVTHHDITYSNNFQPENPYTRLSKAVPLRKFLLYHLIPTTGVILRC